MLPFPKVAALEALNSLDAAGENDSHVNRL